MQPNKGKKEPVNKCFYYRFTPVFFSTPDDNWENKSIIGNLCFHLKVPILECVRAVLDCSYFSIRACTAVKNSHLDASLFAPNLFLSVLCSQAHLLLLLLLLHRNVPFFPFLTYPSSSFSSFPPRPLPALLSPHLLSSMRLGYGKGADVVFATLSFNEKLQFAPLQNSLK